MKSFYDMFTSTLLMLQETLDSRNNNAKDICRDPHAPLDVLCYSSTPQESNIDRLMDFSFAFIRGMTKPIVQTHGSSVLTT